MKVVKIFLEKYSDLIMVGLAFVVSLYLDLPLKKIAFMLVLTWAVLNPVSRQVAIKIVIVIATIVSLLIAFDKVDLAEQATIGLYLGLIYFLLLSLLARKS